MSLLYTFQILISIVYVLHMLMIYATIGEDRVVGKDKKKCCGDMRIAKQTTRTVRIISMVFLLMTIITYMLVATMTAKAYTSDQFVTTWKTDNTSTGSTNNTSIKIPLGNGYTYNFQVDWTCDGTYDTTFSGAGSTYQRYP